MAYSSGSGKNCAIVNCGNNYWKLSRWKKSICDIHSCKEDQVMETIISLNFQVCSIHFVDGKPTKRNPVPQLHLGYESKVCCVFFKL